MDYQSTSFFGYQDRPHPLLMDKYSPVKVHEGLNKISTPLANEKLHKATFKRDDQLSKISRSPNQ
jgi:hypothetical protein